MKSSEINLKKDGKTYNKNYIILLKQMKENSISLRC